MEKEIWKPIKRYEGLYEVSNYGRVRSLDAFLPFGKYVRKRCGRIMRIQNSSNGYKQVHLSKDGESKIYRVHRLVAEAFIDNPNGYPEVNHKDENRANNQADNLEWCTHQYNNSYGNKPARGSKNGMAKLTKTQIVDIRKRRSAGEKLKTIADSYGISVTHTCQITKGKRWGYEMSDN